MSRPMNNENLMSLADQIVWAAETYGIGGMFESRWLDWDTATDVPVDPVVINTWYTALVAMDDVKAWYLPVKQTNNGATIETIEVELTINGTVVVHTSAFVSGTLYYLHLDLNGLFQRQVAAITMGALDFDQGVPLETRSLGIRVRQTTAVDVVSAIIEVNMVYATLEVT